jgi:DNA-binding response OmpR family regulator
MRILVVEEDGLLAEFLRERLCEERFDVLIANQHDQVAAFLSSEKFDGMVLDLSIGDGIELLRQARKNQSNLMIIALAPASSPV